MSYGSSRYGSGVRYGRYERVRQQGQTTDNTPIPDDTISAEDAYGSGFALASNADIERGRAEYPFDLFTNQQGALAIRSGFPYLMQGIALRFVSNATQFLGTVLGPDERADLKLAVQSLATEDERVVAVPTDNIDIRQSPENPDTIEIGMRVVGERMSHDAIFAAEPPAVAATNEV